MCLCSSAVFIYYCLVVFHLEYPTSDLFTCGRAFELFVVFDRASNLSQGIMTVVRSSLWWLKQLES